MCIEAAAAAVAVPPSQVRIPDAQVEEMFGRLLGETKLKQRPSTTFGLRNGLSTIVAANDEQSAITNLSGVLRCIHITMEMKGLECIYDLRVWWHPEEGNDIFEFEFYTAH